jgi:protease-4
MTKRGSMSAYGSQSIGKFIEKANASPKVNSILMVFDGPGGAVDGTPELGNAIANSKKPIIGFVDGMAASAHYWTASQTAYLVGNSQNYTEVGSIGVLTMLVSQQEWLVKQGLKVEIMRAEQSVDKALLNSIEEWPAAAKAELQLQLNEIAADFKATVIAGRGSRLSTGEEDIFTGKMYSLDKAIELGMVDYAMTLAEAVDFAAEVGASRAATT